MKLFGKKSKSESSEQSESDASSISQENEEMILERNRQVVEAEITETIQDDQQELTSDESDSTSDFESDVMSDKGEQKKQENSSESYHLTKNQFLVHLYDDVIDKQCSVEALLRYVVYFLPGLSMERKKKILTAGPSLSSYSSSKEEIKNYAYGKLIQYQCSQDYKQMRQGIKCPMNTNMLGIPLFERMHVHEDMKRHVVTIDDEPRVDLT